eukprot:1303297-Rhodomonas_salina.3
MRFLVFDFGVYLRQTGGGVVGSVSGGTSAPEPTRSEGYGFQSQVGPGHWQSQFWLGPRIMAT